MAVYAILNQDAVASSIALYQEPLDNPPSNYIEINESEKETVLWSKYENNQWSIEKFLPPVIEPQETIEQKLDRIENRRQDDTLMQLDVLATIYEELLMSKESV